MPVLRPRWIGERAARLNNIFRNSLNDQVLTEINAGADSLSLTTQKALERCAPEIRQEIVNRQSLLYRACEKGQIKIVQYLIETCGADIEQHGIYSIQQDRSVHIVTPLWCAAVSGDLKMMELLLKAGADVNAASDSGSTPLRSACFMSHIDVVKLLLVHGANINQTNFNGGTCLINSVQSPELCNFLLENGANINAYDIQGKTALHYAIQEHRLDTTKILLDNGADPSAETRYGDDALQMACLTATSPIFEYLTSNISYEPERLANAHELIGASFLDVKTDVSVCLNHWGIALRIRHENGLYPKVPALLPQIEAYRNQKEFETVEELSALEGNMVNIRTHSLLVTERVLGTQHRDTMQRLMFQGAAYADQMRYQHCIDLWSRALHIRVERDSILSSDSQFIVKALVMIMVDYHVKSLQEGIDNMDKRRNDIVETFKLICMHILWAKPLLQIRPQLDEQLHTYEKTLRYLIYLIHLLIETAKTEANQNEVKRMLTILLKENVRCFMTGNSLLHFVVLSSHSTIEHSLPQTNRRVARDMIAKILLQCGNNVNATNHQGCTPLHVATSRKRYYSPELVTVLLDFGAHLDQVDGHGFTAVNVLRFKNHQHSSLINCTSLKCLCATKIVKSKIPYEGQLPFTLEQFMKLHKRRPIFQVFSN
ncbi:unnamed protein product [Ceutorhynchus assimilis]|uniref:Uncharacterized protein n=1 Tax=Ceutorhynchus assimilis TaxID=467358 RepID=A0A9N9MU79_9CUCU|nr:unnamed protein product [Ceutorhynchus assimilis]